MHSWFLIEYNPRYDIPNHATSDCNDPEPLENLVKIRTIPTFSIRILENFFLPRWPLVSTRSFFISQTVTTLKQIYFFKKNGKKLKHSRLLHLNLWFMLWWKALLLYAKWRMLGCNWIQQFIIWNQKHKQCLHNFDSAFCGRVDD